jgi:hypothetical protein
MDERARSPSSHFFFSPTICRRNASKVAEPGFWPAELSPSHCAESVLLGSSSATNGRCDDEVEQRCTVHPQSEEPVISEGKH